MVLKRFLYLKSNKNYYANYTLTWSRVAIQKGCLNSGQIDVIIMEFLGWNCRCFSWETHMYACHNLTWSLLLNLHLSCNSLEIWCGRCHTCHVETRANTGTHWWSSRACERKGRSTERCIHGWVHWPRWPLRKVSWGLTSKL